MFELGVLGWLWVGAAVLVASIVRGVAGFGFSLIVTVLVTHMLPPAVVIPAVLIWEICASIGHLPFVYRQVAWKPLAWLTLGMLFGTPLGVWALAHMDAKPMCLLINGLVVLFAIMLLRGNRPSRAPGPVATSLIGAVCGVINGTSANGGPPAILLFLSSPAGVAVGRASLIAYFLMTDTWASLFCWQNDLFSAELGLFAAAMLPVLYLGVALGSRFFRGLDEAHFRKIVLVLLMAVAAVGLVKSLF